MANLLAFTKSNININLDNMNFQFFWKIEQIKIITFTNMTILNKDLSKS